MGIDFFHSLPVLSEDTSKLDLYYAKRLKEQSLRGAERRGNPMRLLHFALHHVKYRASFAMTLLGSQLIYAAQDSYELLPLPMIYSFMGIFDSQGTPVWQSPQP